MTESRRSIGFVGFGKRVENVYLPVLKKLESKFEISGFSSRRKDREDEVSSKYGLNALSGPNEVCEKSDLVIAFSPPDTHASVLSRIQGKCKNILIETPIVDHTLIEMDLSSSSTVSVAEQWPFLPYEQFKQKFITSGIIERPFFAQNDCRSLDYHAIAQLRTYLGRDIAPALAFGNMTGSRSPGYTDKNKKIRPPGEIDAWDIGQVRFSNGAVLSHNFAYACKIAPFRSIQTLRYYSSNGTVISGKKDDKDNDYEIFDIRYVNTAGDTVKSDISVKRGLNNTVIEISDSASGVTWVNPYGDIGLTDQEIAIAALVSSAADGEHPYSIRDAFVDNMLVNAIKQSCQTSQVINFNF